MNVEAGPVAVTSKLASTGQFIGSYGFQSRAYHAGQADHEAAVINLPLIPSAEGK